MQAFLTLDIVAPHRRESLARDAYRAYGRCGVALTEEILASARGVEVKEGVMFTLSDGMRIFGDLVRFEDLDLPELEDAA